MYVSVGGLGQARPAIVVVPTSTRASPRGCRSNPGAHDPRCPPGQRIHHGSDIAAPEGSPIVIPKDGIVQKVWRNGDMSRYGNMLLVYVPEDNVTLVFAHMKELAARADGTRWREGDPVRAGDQAGLVGYTGACRGSRSVHGVGCTPCGPGGGYLCGGASGSHLHFEVRPGHVNRPNPAGVSRDPQQYAAQKSFLLHGGAGVAGLGSINCANANFYCDPQGFEPGDEHWFDTALRYAPWVAGGLGAALATYFAWSRLSRNPRRRKLARSRYLRALARA